LFALSFTCLDASAAPAKLKLVKRLWGTGEVHLVDQGQDKLLYRYDDPVAVRESELSPDGSYAFVWYTPARPPLQLAIFDLRTMKRTAHFSPGTGGEMHFTPGGNIAHWWGCGTNCSVLALYDIHGKKLLETSNSGTEISPSRRFAATGPSLFAADEPVVVYDLDSGRALHEINQKRGDSFILDEVRWDESRGEAVLKLDYLHSKGKTLTLKTGRVDTHHAAK
jgi:hypothetical protein